MLRLCSESSCSYPGRSVQHAAIIAMGVGLRAISKGVELPPNPKVMKAALYGATHRVIGQKSAEAIVAQCLG
jgi:hypothetical protein